jgi:hypothetical protein
LAYAAVPTAAARATKASASLVDFLMVFSCCIVTPMLELRIFNPSLYLFV